jgi:hypothetical protein
MGEIAEWESRETAEDVNRIMDNWILSDEARPISDKVLAQYREDELFREKDHVAVLLVQAGMEAQNKATLEGVVRWLEDNKFILAQLLYDQYRGVDGKYVKSVPLDEYKNHDIWKEMGIRSNQAIQTIKQELKERIDNG